MNVFTKRGTKFCSFVKDSTTAHWKIYSFTSAMARRETRTLKRVPLTVASQATANATTIHELHLTCDNGMRHRERQLKSEGLGRQRIGWNCWPSQATKNATLISRVPSGAWCCYGTHSETTSLQEKNPIYNKKLRESRSSPRARSTKSGTLKKYNKHNNNLTSSIWCQEYNPR